MTTARPIGDAAVRELLFLAGVEGIDGLSRGGKGCVFRAVELLRPDIAAEWADTGNPFSVLKRHFPEPDDEPVPAWTGADDLPNPEPPEPLADVEPAQEWPERVSIMEMYANGEELDPQAWIEAERRWKEEPRLRAALETTEHAWENANGTLVIEIRGLRSEVERLKTFEDEALGLRERIDRAIKRLEGEDSRTDEAWCILTYRWEAIAGQLEADAAGVWNGNSAEYLAGPSVGREMLRLANEAEVYRKALEPFLDRLPLWLEEGALNGRPENAWFEGSLTEEHTAALREACRLMGIHISEDSEAPSAPEGHQE